MKPLAKHGLALLSMIGGTTLAFGTVILMNAYEEPPKEANEGPKTDFQVKKKPPPKRKKPKPKPRPKRRRLNASAPTPAPNLSSTISAPGLQLPGFDVSDLGGDMSEKLLGDTDKKVTAMAGAACDEPPAPTRRAKPEFPDSARRKGISGRVKLSVKIGTDGRVEAIKVVEASPPGVFEGVAKSAMQDWEFSPCVYENEPVVGWVTQSMVFKLGEKT